MNKVEDVARKKLDTDQRLQYMPAETIHRELLQELDRFVCTSVFSTCLHMRRYDVDILKDIR